MAENPNQPDKKRTHSVAELAQYKRLNRFSDVDLIDKYAERFGKDPDFEVFPRVSFSTIAFFAIKWKETAEYHQRFSYFWRVTSPESVSKHE